MSNSKKPSLWVRMGITSLLCLALMFLFELYLRREVSYVIQRGVREAGGMIQHDPEVLVHYPAGERRFVPHADVTIVNHFISGLNVGVKINSLGFRGAELEVPKPPHRYRIMVLGDSITVADYLPLEQGYVERVNFYLKQKNISKEIEVVNAGIGNIGIEEEVNILEDHVTMVNPDLVVVGFYLNDSRPPWGFSGEIGDRGWLRRHSLLAETIYRNVKQRSWEEDQGKIRFGWIEESRRMNWKRSREDFLKLAKSAWADWGAAWDEKGWTEVESELNRLSEISRKSGFKVLVVGFPVSFQVYADFLEDAPQKRVEGLTRQLGFDFLDLLPILRGHREDSELFYDHCHPKAHAHDIIGGAIAERLNVLAR